MTGAFIALVSGGFLLTVWRPLAFIISAGFVTGVTIIFSFTIRNYYRRRIQTSDQTIKGTLSYAKRMLKNEPDIRNLLIANGFWNATLQIIQAFTVLFFTQGMGRTSHFVSGLIFPIAAIGIIIMAPLAGKLADKYGHRKTLLISCIIYGIGNLIPVFTQRFWVIAVIPIVSGAATALMTLPYAALMKLINGQPHGAISGLFGISRGVGTFLGPIVAGALITLCQPIFKSTHGYAGEWLAAGLFILLSLPFLLRIKSQQL